MTREEFEALKEEVTIALSPCVDIQQCKALIRRLFSELNYAFDTLETMSQEADNNECSLNTCARYFSLSENE